MWLKLFSLLIVAALFVACQNSNQDHQKKKAGEEYEIDDSLPPTGEKLSGAEKKERLAILISESRKTLDSIDAAYSTIRKESRRRPLSLDEREQVNEALMELNDAKDLIVLEVERDIINELKEKTESLQTVMQNMQVKSEKLVHIAQTLSRVSGIIEKTTNLLAGALSAGIIRPRITATDTPS